MRRGSTHRRFMREDGWLYVSLSAACFLSVVLSAYSARTMERWAAFVKILVLASAKGGSSKSSLAAHLAVAAEMAGDGPAVLIDADPRGSLAAWWNVREAEAPALAPTSLAELPGKLAALAQAGYAVAILDTPPAITDAIRAVVRLGDFVLIYLNSLRIRENFLAFCG